MHWPIQQAARVVEAGGIIAYPTEAVYGLGCDPLNINAVLRLLLLKHRPITQGLILVAADKHQLAEYVIFPDEKSNNEIDASWPGPVTWLVPAQSWVPYWLTGEHDTLAVRVSAHPLVRELCLELEGPLISTSANLHGRPPARNASQARKNFTGKINYFVNGQTGTLSKPTEIRDLKSGQIVRA